MQPSLVTGSKWGRVQAQISSLEVCCTGLKGGCSYYADRT